MPHAAPGTDPFTPLYDEELRLVLFGGKGGVGKTTMAAAFALQLSERFPRHRVLALSADPAHSLSDSLRFPLGATPEPVYGLENLHGVELDAAELLDLFRRRHGEALTEILDRGTYLDRDDLSRFLELSFPGLDEVMVLLRVVEFLEEGAFDLVVADTAPTGHTLRLLELPEVMRGWTAFLDTLMAKHRYLARLYTRGYRPDEADRLIEWLSCSLDSVRELLLDGRRCRFVPVATAEPVVLTETGRLLRAFERMGIPVGTLFVNQVRSEAKDCRRCLAVAKGHARRIEDFRREWPELDFRIIPAFAEEVVGDEALRNLQAGAWPAPEVQEPEPRCGPSPEPVTMAAPGEEARLFLFCGKGGVGKTTLASAFAVELSRVRPERSILLFSTDPAHSLSDCLAQPFDGVPRTVGATGNLSAVEVDPAPLFQEFKERHARQIEEVFQEFSRGGDIDLAFDREVMSGLLNLAPPGLDEIIALAELMGYMADERFDLYVVDTAPTGHALRFLELPDLVRQWLNMFFEIVLKYRSAVRLPTLSEALVDLSRKVKRVQELLSDPARCESTLVSIATTMALAETERLAATLEKLEIPVRRVLVNRLLPGTDECPHCRTAARGQGEIWTRHLRRFSELEVVSLPEWPSDLTGIEALSRVMMFADPVAVGG